MEVEIFKLPTKDDPVSSIEKKYCELSKRYRDGDKLDEVEITWMDQANVWLQAF